MSVILSVDDDPDVIAGRRILLQRAGYDVLDATDGEEALHILQRSSVDLVLLDFYMPGLDGAALAREMKHERPYVPVIMVSGSADCADHARAYIDSFVFKGTGPECLLEEIARFLAPAGRLRERTGT
jgi:CheY-like chemotaxis protein